ncbi:hypothetical protein DFH28DRAFT_447884 [Melampsora americana]|nr:hypothetical protein DFH28DRAFT_447884 [Melampsora americana]
MRDTYAEEKGCDEVGEAKKLEAKNGLDCKHPYIRRKLGCPCPALATMINHSYITPKDSKESIPWFQLINGLMNCYSLSFPFAFLFVLVVNLRLKSFGGFSIEMLKTHGVLEHDASISRWDASEGDALNPDPDLVSKFLDSIHYPNQIAEEDKMITLEDYARTRHILEKSIIEKSPHQSMTKLHILGIGEAVLAVKVFEDQRSILPGIPMCARSDWLREWYNEERLPIGLKWKKPRQTINLFEVIWIAYRMSKMMKKIE